MCNMDADSDEVRRRAGLVGLLGVTVVAREDVKAKDEEEGKVCGCVFELRNWLATRRQRGAREREGG